MLKEKIYQNSGTIHCDENGVYQVEIIGKQGFIAIWELARMYTKNEEENNDETIIWRAIIIEY